jgi:hypothetical protein
MWQWALVGAQDQNTWARGCAIACEAYSTLCADEQDRRGGRTAIWTAMQQPEMRTVAAKKTADQQAMLRNIAKINWTITNASAG